MVNILTKLCLGRTIGVFFSGEHVSITDLGITLKGLTVLNQQSYELGERKLIEVLQEYIKLYGGKGAKVCIGLKPEQMFFITSAIIEQGTDEQIRDKLLERAGFHHAEERLKVVADYFYLNKVKSTTGQLWSIGVCRRDFANELYAAFTQAGFRNCLFKPTPWAMSIFVARLPKKCKNWQVFVQVFIGEAGGVAVLVAEKHPICWKRFSSANRDEVITAIRSIYIQSAVILGRNAIEGIIVYAGNAGEFCKKINDDLGFETVEGQGADFSDSNCSYSLALAARDKDSDRFDVFREIRPKPGILKIFPWKIAASIVLSVLCMAFIMWQKANDLADSYHRLKRQNATYKWAVSRTTADISKERKNLLTEASAIEKFLMTRIIWSNYLRDLPTRIPLNISLTNIWGDCEYMEGRGEQGGGRKSRKSFTIRGMTLFEKGKASPAEIDSFLESLRKIELLQKDFGDIKLGEIKWRQEGKRDIAMFTILATPKKDSKKG